MPADGEAAPSPPLYAGCEYVGLPPSHGLRVLHNVEHPAPRHANDEERLAMLRSLDVLDSPRDEALDAVCKSLARFVGTPVACVTLVDEDRTFVAGACQFDKTEVNREESICTWSTHREETTIIADTRASAYRDLPLVAHGPLRFYASAPLVVRTSRVPLFLGALCVIADAPRQLSAAEVEALEDMRAVVLQLLLRRSEGRRVMRVAEQQEQLLALQERRLLCRPVDGGGGPQEVMEACVRTAREALAASSVVVARPQPTSPADREHPAADPAVCFCAGPAARPRGPPALVLASAAGTCAGAAPRGLLRDHCIAVAAGPQQVLTATRPAANCFLPTERAFLSSVAAIIAAAAERAAAEAELAARAAALRQQEAQLAANERTERLLLRALEASGDPIAVFDAATGANVFTNGAWLPVTGFSRDEIASAPFPPPGLLPPESAARVARAFAARERASFEVLGARRGGGSFHVHCRIESSLPGTIFVVLHDVTLLRLAQEESRSKSRFLSIMSHEIRTPLWGILSSSALLLERPGLEEEVRELAETVQTAGDALLSLVNDVLDYSRAEADALTLDPRPFDLLELLDASLALVAGRLTPAHQLACLLDPAVPRRLVGDPVRCKQILTNLLANACKFSEGGPIVVRVGLDSTPPTPGEVRLLCSVSDGGIGINEAGIRRLFRCFSQVDDSATRRYEGSGLGLSIARALCERMDGRIWCESREGHGSTFSFTIALGCPGGPVAPPRGPPESAPRVLVLESSDAVREMLVGALAALGARACGAARAEDCGAAGIAGPFDAAFIEAGDDRGPAEAALERVPGGGGARLVALLPPAVAAALSRKRRLSSLRQAAGGEREAADEADDAGTTSPPRLAEGGALAAVLRKPLSFARIRKAYERAVPPSGRPSPQPSPRPSLRGPPAALAPAGPAAGALPLEAGRLAVPFALLRVLVVEDNLINQKVLHKILLSAGVHDGHIKFAGNGREAVEQYGRAGDTVDLIFMDLHMPLMGGIEATGRILAHAAEAGLYPPFVCAVTADVVGSVRDECFAAGMRCYLSKPFRRAEFEVVLASVAAHAAAAPHHRPPAGPRAPSPTP